MKTLATILIALSLCLSAAAQVACYPGDSYKSCTPAEQTARAKIFKQARAIAIVVEAKRSISCGDGSDSPCEGKDYDSINVINAEIKAANWGGLRGADAKQADLIVKFVVASGQVYLEAFDADSSVEVWGESRTVVALSNDVARLIVRFVTAWQPVVVYTPPPAPVISTPSIPYCVVHDSSAECAATPENIKRFCSEAHSSMHPQQLTPAQIEAKEQLQLCQDRRSGSCHAQIVALCDATPGCNWCVEHTK